MGLSAGSGYVRNGPLEIYYEVEGSGPPLLLLHGGLCTIETFGELRRRLARQWTTIAVEQQSHGHTADIDRPLTFEQMADDTAAVLRHLGVSGCHAYGWSDGGNVALGLAIRHPELAGRIAICGTNGDNDGLLPQVLTYMRDGLKQDPLDLAASMPAWLREPYEKVAPRPRDFPVLIQRVFEQVLAFRGWTDGELRSVRAPVMVMIGDRDVIPIAHAHRLFTLFASSRLCIMPGTDHMAPITRVEWTADMLGDFLLADADAGPAMPV